MKTLLFVVLSLLSTTAFGESYRDFLKRQDAAPKYDLYLNVNGASHHINSNREFNEDNMGFGLILEKDNKTSISYGTVGYYDNSVDETSLYLGYGYKKPLVKYHGFLVQTGVLAGVIIGGYESEGAGVVLPMGLLTLTVGIKDIRTTLSYAPKVNDATPAVIIFNIQIGI